MPYKNRISYFLWFSSECPSFDCFFASWVSFSVRTHQSGTLPMGKIQWIPKWCPLVTFLKYFLILSGKQVNWNYRQHFLLFSTRQIISNVIQYNDSWKSFMVCNCKPKLLYLNYISFGGGGIFITNTIFISHFPSPQIHWNILIRRFLTHFDGLPHTVCSDCFGFIVFVCLM